VHIIFDEATAVLAGDALLALAFEVLADGRTYADSSVRAQLVLELARAVGASGMAGGQMLDLYPDVDADLAAVTRLQRLKTGALVSWCVEAGAIMGGASADERTSLRGYAQSVGLAFQIADDLLDKSGDENKVGKRLRKDEAQGKATFLSLLGPERARLQAEALVGQAVDHLRGIDADTSLLADIARFAITRDR
jgi:farnesyl diphosphate synthase